MIAVSVDLYVSVVLVYYGTDSRGTSTVYDLLLAFKLT